ncbi:histone-lysine N-methyltransferase PRDM9-like [Macrobrachium nipponense]|uniref:histone-lysine N-methyltransferase PRDM9-like n=1 Tax=Macrobrachium nipponense TaxID=159736 RepID=UPI0030C8C903
MAFTGQSQVPKSSAVDAEDFKSGLAATSGETATEKLKLGHSRVNEEKSVPVSTTQVAPKTGVPSVLKYLLISKRVYDLYDVPNKVGESEGIIAGDSRERKGCSGNEITGDTGEVVDTGLQTSKSPKVTEAIEDVSNSSTDRKYECKLCLSVLKNRLLFWQHLHEHSQEVPYTCKNCLENFDNEKVLKIHYMHRCGCAACGKQIRGSHAGPHAKGCRLGNPFLCTGCSNRFPSSDVFRKHLRSHINKENSYICKECGEIFLCKSDARKHEFLKNNCSGPVIQAFTSEADIFKFDFPDEEREEVMPLSPVNIESEFNSSALDPLAIDKEESSAFGSIGY